MGKARRSSNLCASEKRAMVYSVDADKTGAARIAHPLIHRDSSGKVEECKMVLRKYEAQDSKIICGWIKDAKQLYQWSADKIGRLLGHLFIRYPNKDDKTLVRFGFIILSPESRGKGNGKKMVELAIEYAKNVLHASKIILGVFTNNERARLCYEAAGFQPTGETATYTMPDGVWECIEMELKI